MALLDIVNEISEKKFQKTETGDARIQGVVLGIVTENYHKDMPGRVRVKIPVREEEANILKWAKVARPYGGKDWGHYFMPEKEDQVLVAFEHGNIEMPFVIAAVPRDRDRIINRTSDEENQYKKIVTRNGNSLIFEDNKDGDGEKDRIRICTPKEAHQLMLDNENKKITLADKEKNCVLEMKTEGGKILVKAAQTLTFEIGDSIKVSLNGDNGTVLMDADKVKISASRSMELTTDGTLKLSGQQTVVEASSSLKQSSSGMVSISGSPIKVG